ncbi:calcium-activated chloride channel regulator 1 isoform X2 [Procambarus clarkii]|uniref:calcium-activated chloride channel regulator 1 isoform X2 n=1 Tax=Procambarus clarkii TaxID=6728 RepID=UPI003743D3D9
MKMHTSFWGATLLLLFALGVRGQSRAKLVNNGYEDVVVAISQEVDEMDGPDIIASIKEMIQESSRRLYRATHTRAYFRSVKILIPKSWTNTSVIGNALSENFQNSDIRVDIMNSVYKNQPYTHQSGGCGDPGLYIHLTPEYLIDRAQAAWWGPRGKVLLLEWAKYRWGVFDELGYPGDESFPLFYVWDENTSGVPGGGTILPTYCANIPVEGRRIDKRGRSICSLTPQGEPDKDCRFLPYRDQRATSSLMSYPLIFSDTVVDFCSGPDSDHPHNAVAPTKQNLFCGGRSVWDIMMMHEDFANNANPPTERYMDPEIQVIQHADANYALVLDYSGSMNDHYRIHKLRKTARRWILHEVTEGSYVAIIKFSKRASLVHRLSQITDEASRKTLADSIETKADGGTSIGAGLYVAVKKILANVKNPVILLITDGEENENPRIKDVLQNVLDSGVRVITVAFGAEADPKLEKIAEMTGGKTFTVNDIDEGHMLEDAFDGALTYQPPPPRSNTTVTIHEEVYRGTERYAGSKFNVDFTIGKNLVLRLDTDDRQHIVHEPHMVRPDGNIVGGAVFDPNTFTWILTVPLAEEGEWKWRVGLSGSPDNFIRVKVTAQTRDPTVHPITTRAWISSGTREVNATRDRVIIYAEVKQGNNPVVNADVRALVTPPSEFEPDQEYILLDNGQGADIQSGDGIYSRYMTHYSATGRYSVKAQVTDGGTAVINRGFLTSSQRKRRSAENDEDFEERPDYCCGSHIPLHHKNTQVTGTFNRISVAGSVKVTEIPVIDNQPPAAVRDLHIVLLDDIQTDTLSSFYNVSLSWTAPGDDLDVGNASSYILRMTKNRSDLAEKYFNNASKETLIDTSGYPFGVEAGEKINITLKLFLVSDVTFYLALRAKDEAGGESPVSNIAVLRLEVNHHLLQPEYPQLLLPVWAITLILALLVLLIIFVSVILASRKYGKYECVQVET